MHQVASSERFAPPRVVTYSTSHMDVGLVRGVLTGLALVAPFWVFLALGVMLRLR